MTHLFVMLALRFHRFGRQYIQDDLASQTYTCTDATSQVGKNMVGERKELKKP